MLKYYKKSETIKKFKIILNNLQNKHRNLMLYGRLKLVPEVNHFNYFNWISKIIFDL
jgi:hypothetical protein